MPTNIKFTARLLLSSSFTLLVSGFFRLVITNSEYSLGFVKPFLRLVEEPSLKFATDHSDEVLFFSVLAVS